MLTVPVKEIEPSVVVAPAFVQELPRSTVSLPIVTVITGEMVSSTITVLVAVPTFPEASVAV